MKRYTLKNLQRTRRYVIIKSIIYKGLHLNFILIERGIAVITAAKAMVKCLEEERIEVLFGYPGAAICPFYDALSASKIRHILVRQEQNAGHEASGYARTTGRPAVCVATSGPGALNLIPAVAAAYADSIPMVVITGQVIRELLGSDVFQEADITGAVEPFSKYSYIVKDAAQIPRVFKEAFYLAGTGRPGPVIIDVPMDVQMEKIRFDYPETVALRSYKPTLQGHPGQIKRVLMALKSAKRPLIMAGGGVFSSGAREELIAFAHKAQIPVISTMMGIGTFPTDDPLYFGMVGMHGKRAANQALAKTDLLLLIGARAADRAVQNPQKVNERTKIVHIDIDPAEIGKNLLCDIPLVGDAKNILNALLEKVSDVCDDSWRETLQEICDHSERKEPVYEGCINPKAFLRKLSQKAEPDAIVVADVGQNQIWTAGNYCIRHGRFLTSGGMGTMGYSIPAAIGAKLAAPKRQVFSICGDGSFQMQMMELGTIRQHDIPLKMIVMTNRKLGMVRELQERFYAGNETAVDLTGSPNVAKLAEAYEIPSARIADEMEVETAIQALLEAKGPFLLEILVSPQESTL